MSLDALRSALEELSDTPYCEGDCRITERLAIALPDGDVGAIDDPGFVDWLLEHSEPAPFGRGGETVLDDAVRKARRLIARGAASVTGFDPAQVLGEIEEVLSPRAHLDARLTDVLVYREGGHFTRHKDTPNDPKLVGTLIVGLPIAHEGGAFRITGGGAPIVIDWSVPKGGRVSWVAMFSDVDHAIEPVTSGARVTLVYALTRSDRPRADPASDGVIAKLDQLAGRLRMPARGPIMIACSRHVITEDETQPLGIDVLRGTDRLIADVLVARGFSVTVRSCVTAAMAYERTATDPLTRDSVFSISRLSTSLPAKLIASLDNLCTFIEIDESEQARGIQTLAPYVLDAVPISQWVIRSGAAATLIHEAADFSEDGAYGNEGYEAHIYTLAALEVSKEKPKANPKSRPRMIVKKRPAKTP